MVRYPILVILITLGSFIEIAGASCYQPSAPTCAGTFGAFDDESDFEQCKREMEGYKSEVENFLACQKKEDQEATDDYNNAVESFNRRANEN
jgi:hypothetical protein